MGVSRRLVGCLFVLLSLPLPNRAQSPGKATYTLDPRVEVVRPSRFNLSLNGGLGLLQVVSPETLNSGEMAFEASAFNFDRDPGDLDFVEFSFQAAIGVSRKGEVFFKTTPVLRTTSVHQDPLRFPMPPLDVFVDTYPTPALRPQPWLMFAQEAPYKTYDIAHRTAVGAFSSSSGDNTLGFKWNLRSIARGDPEGIGVRVYAEIPTENPRYNIGYPDWHKLAGSSGKANFGGGFLYARRWKTAEILANAGYKRVGDPDRGIRVQQVDSSQSNPAKFLVGSVTETKLNLSDELRFSTGVTFPVFSIREPWWFIGEFSHTRFVGSHTPVERIVNPLEFSLGLQSTVPGYRHLALGVAWQLLLNSGGNFGYRTTNLETADGRGDINFGESVDYPNTAEIERYFTSRGATFSPGSSKVFMTNNRAFDAWRNVPTQPGIIRSEGHGNIVASITWRSGVRR